MMPVVDMPVPGPLLLALAVAEEKALDTAELADDILKRDVKRYDPLGELSRSFLRLLGFLKIFVQWMIATRISGANP